MSEFEENNRPDSGSSTVDEVVIAYQRSAAEGSACAAAATAGMSMRERAAFHNVISARLEALEDQRLQESARLAAQRVQEDSARRKRAAEEEAETKAFAVRRAPKQTGWIDAVGAVFGAIWWLATVAFLLICLLGGLVAVITVLKTIWNAV